MRKAVLVSLIFLLLLPTAMALKVGDYEYAYVCTHEDGVLTVTAYTDDPLCSKVSFKYWNGSQHGKPDVWHKQIPTFWNGTHNVAIDATTEVCEGWWIIEVLFHNTSNPEGSVKVDGEVLVPWFSNLTLSLLAGAIMSALLIKGRWRK